MNICLNVEDGSSVADANTYLTIEEAEKILNQLGYCFEDGLTETQKAQYLIRSAFYLESFRDSYCGKKTDPAQGLQWPRTGASIDCVAIASNVIPNELKRAQALGAYYESTGKSLQSVSKGKEVASKKVAGALELTYFENGMTEGQYVFTPIINSLEPLLSRSSSGFKVGRA